MHGYMHDHRGACGALAGAQQFKRNPIPAKENQPEMHAGIKSICATPPIGHVRRNAGHVAGISGHVHRNTQLANLTAVGTGTTILDGSSVIGDMDVNALVTATDTITLRHDRTYAFDQGALKWNVSSTASAGTLAEVGLVNVNYGAGSDGNLYGIGGVELAKTIDVDALPSSATDQFILNVSCGAPKVSALFADGKWRLGISALDFPSGSAIPVCLQIVNATLHKFAVVSFKAIGLAPTNSATTSIPPSGSGTLTTGDGYVVTLQGNNLGKTVNATLLESKDPDGNRIVSITFDADVTNAGIAVKLPDVNALVLSKTVLATRRIQAATAAVQPTKLPDTLPDPYPYSADEGNLGKKWDQALSVAPDGINTVRLNGATRAWTLNNSKVRIPKTEVLVAQSPDAGWLCEKFTKPGSTPCNTFEVTNREVSALYSVLDQKSWDIGDAEVVVFINGFQIETPGDLITPYIGGGTGTWGEFPRLAKNPKLFGGKRLIPFEFRWATNARFSDAANDLAKSINLIRAELNLGNTQKIHLVAHSFGGLLVRTLLQGFATPDHYPNLTSGSDPNIDVARLSVKSVMTLGTPHSGIRFSANPDFLPTGTDFDLIANCNQASCYEAGLANVKNIAHIELEPLSTDEKKILYGGDLKSYAGSTVNPAPVYPGFLPTYLATISNLPDINFFVGIGLRKGSVSGSAGDHLISYEGQRFSPPLRSNKLLGNVAQGALTTESFLGAKVHEKILGSIYRPAFDGQFTLANFPFLAPRENGYAHQARLPHLLPKKVDGESWGLEAGVKGGCEAGQDSTCAHAGVLLLRDLLTAPVPVVALSTPGSMIANNIPQPVTLTGANFLSTSVVQMRGGFDSWVTVPNWVTEPNPDPGNSVSSTQITVIINPGTATNVFGIRVCRGGYTIADADCSAEFGVTTTAPPQGQVFRDDFNGTTFDLNKWAIEPPTSVCCGTGNLGILTQSGGFLNINVAGGSCGACGRTDGTILRAQIAPLTGDFEVILSGEELERTSRDGTRTLGVMSLRLSGGTQELGIYVVGDAKNNSGTPGHTIIGYYQNAGATGYIVNKELTIGQYYAMQFRIRRASGKSFLAYRLEGDATWTEAAAPSNFANTEVFTAPRVSVVVGDGRGTTVNSIFRAKLDFMSIQAN